MNFTHKKQDGLSGKTEDVFQQVDGTENTSFEVYATNEGVFFRGRSSAFKHPQDFEALAKAIGDAGKKYSLLKKDLQKTILVK